MGKVTSSCNPCAGSGRPANPKKISLKHVNRESNMEVQADFFTIKLGNDNYELLNVVDCSTACGERAIVNSRSADSMLIKFDEIWLCLHGTPAEFSADPELCLTFFK